MKILGFILGYISGGSRTRNGRLVAKLTVSIVALVAVFSTIFHELMAREGRYYSWTTAIYWTMTTMSTLGFGDITFHSDIGRAFSVVVLLTGTVTVLVLLPFVFIEFLFLPWIRARDANRTPRQLPPETADHVVLVGPGPVTDAVIKRFESDGIDYVVIEPDREEALHQYEAGRRVMVGDVDHPDTYRSARVQNAALVATLMNDAANTNTTFTVREISADVPIASVASSQAAAEVMRLAGSTTVLQLPELLGTSIAARVLGRSGRHEVIGEFGPLIIAEALVEHPDLVNTRDVVRTVRRDCDTYVVGVWHKGQYVPLDLDATVNIGDALILAGSRKQLARWDAAYGLGRADRSGSRVLVIGAGRVGRAAVESLKREGFNYTVVELRPDHTEPGDEHYIVGDARDIDTLEQAGIHEADSVLITTHDDDLNVYITITCRRLRPDVQILARSNKERNVATLDRAGADAVLSYATLGASFLRNAIGMDATLVVAEGIELLRLATPPKLVGRSLAEANVIETTGCRTVALVIGDKFQCNPDRNKPLPPDSDLVLIADNASLVRFHDRFETMRKGLRANGQRFANVPHTPDRTDSATATNSTDSTGSAGSTDTTGSSK